MMKKIWFPLIIVTFLVISLFIYRQSCAALNSAATYVNAISLDYYVRRGMVQKKPQMNEASDLSVLRTEISKGDLYFVKSPLNAVLIYENLLKKDPGNMSLHLRMGMIFLKLGEHDTAREHLSFVYENKDSGLQPDAAWFLGLISVLQDEKTEAKTLLQECISKKCSYRNEAENLISLI